LEAGTFGAYILARKAGKARKARKSPLGDKTEEARSQESGEGLWPWNNGMMHQSAAG
jgi:hypothetical protein